jgi:hypothetical protein
MRERTVNARCACPGPTEVELLGFNSVDKPIVRCRDCNEQATAPLDAVTQAEATWARQRAELATDGGEGQ